MQLRWPRAFSPRVPPHRPSTWNRPHKVRGVCPCHRIRVWVLPCRSAALAEGFGWDSAPTPNDLAAQLGALGAKHATAPHMASCEKPAELTTSPVAAGNESRHGSMEATGAEIADGTPDVEEQVQPADALLCCLTARLLSLTD